MAKIEKRYVITKTHTRTGTSMASRPLTIAEAIEYYSYTLECGASYSHEKGNRKINRNPKNIASLLTNLNNAVNNAAANGYAGQRYTAEEFVGEVVANQPGM